MLNVREPGRSGLTGSVIEAYAGDVMNDERNHPPVSERQPTTGTLSVTWPTLSYYYWFTNPPAMLEGRTGCTQI
jgi:hypothetical protein